MIPPEIVTEVPQSELQDAIDGFHKQKPPPVSVTSTPDGPGTFTIIAIFPSDAQGAPDEPDDQPDSQDSKDAPTPGEVAVGNGDKQCIPKLIQLGGNVNSVHQTQAAAANSMKAKGYGYTLHNGCAATLCAFLNEAGISIKTTLGAGKLAYRLSSERHWERVAVGKQQAGDVGVAKNDVHIYLVVATNGTDKMTIADNQAPVPHQRFASGKGKTPTAYFLRASDEHIQVADLAARFYTSVDQDTSNLTEV